MKILVRQFSSKTVAKALEYAVLGTAPVAVMDELALRDGIDARLRWALGAVTLIAQNPYADDCIKDAADAAAVQIEQARDMWRALSQKQRHRSTHAFNQGR